MIVTPLAKCPITSRNRSMGRLRSPLPSSVTTGILCVECFISGHTDRKRRIDHLDFVRARRVVGVGRRRPSGLRAPGTPGGSAPAGRRPRETRQVWDPAVTLVATDACGLTLAVGAVA